MNMLKGFTKRGAVFGIDARIALVIISIASLAIASNKLSVNESQSIQDTQFKILSLSDHILEQYSTYHDDILDIENIYAASAADQNKFWSKNSDLKYDGWGNEWKIVVRTSETDNIKAYGKPIVPKCIILFSAGADGYHHLFESYTSTTYNQCINNTGLTQTATSTEEHDDMFYKFTTVDYEIAANETVEQSLNSIKQALLNYAQAEKNIRIKYCNDQTAVDANADPKCDIDGNATYEEAELDNVNYMPKSSVDVTAGVKYSNTTAYDMNVVANREAFLEKIGVAKAYNEDPLGRALQYDSNFGDKVVAPFVAEFKYIKCPSCTFN